MSCCPPDSEPGRASSPHSAVTLQHGKTTLYRTGPATAEIGILAFPDVFGPESGRTKADADRLGGLGYAVVVVDVTGGDYLDPDTDYFRDIPAFFARNNFDSVIKPALDDATQYLKEVAQVTTICSYGYCMGCWVGARLSALATAETRGQVSFHPAWMIENQLHGGGSADALAQRVEVPQLLLAAGNDPDFVREGGSVIGILKDKGGRIGKYSRAVNFDGVKHGWVNRGDLEDPTTKKAVDEAWELAIQFIREVCAN